MKFIKNYSCQIILMHSNILIFDSSVEITVYLLELKAKHLLPNYPEWDRHVSLSEDCNRLNRLRLITWLPFTFFCLSLRSVNYLVAPLLFILTSAAADVA